MDIDSVYIISQVPIDHRSWTLHYAEDGHSLELYFEIWLDHAWMGPYEPFKNWTTPKGPIPPEKQQQIKNRVEEWAQSVAKKTLLYSTIPPQTQAELKERYKTMGWSILESENGFTAIPPEKK